LEAAIPYPQQGKLDGKGAQQKEDSRSANQQEQTHQLADSYQSIGK
jgi:hypothetical protein